MDLMQLPIKDLQDNLGVLLHECASQLLGISFKRAGSSALLRNEVHL